MRIQPECIPCILKMSVALLRNLELDERGFDRLYSDILKIPALSWQDRIITSPEVIETVMSLMTESVGNPDPFAAAKAKMNELAETLYPFLKGMVREASDPLHAAVRVAIAGNSIDFMMHEKLSDVESLVRERLDEAISMESYSAFKEKVENSRVIVYLCDNAGEIVFDRLLLETLTDGNPSLEIHAIVRSFPTLNDATLKEAASAGLTGLVNVLENGIDGPLPGTLLRRCRDRVKDLVSDADLIISKGGGNFDTLHGELGDLHTDITFMLLSKCVPYVSYFGGELFRPVLFNAYGKRIPGT